ncbi:MAG: SDR family oxidoreductase [Deltaproteobacteria bacterium]|nr:SDR family oxidoreductase [Deltaproteobacteria bacterium]
MDQGVWEGEFAWLWRKLGRIAYPEDVGHLAAFLVSDKASCITGKVIPLDGGVF